MDGRIEVLKQWIEEGRAHPEEVQIYPTNKCNLKCIFCCQQLEEYNLKDELSEKRWLEVAEELCELGVRKILISGGGEPLAVPVTLRMMELFKSRGLEGRLINNGTLWTEQTINLTVQIGWDSIMFSLDGSSAKIHDSLRGVKGCFDKTITNIKTFNKIKSLAKKNTPRIEVNFVLNKLNYKEVPDTVKLANELGLNFVNFEPICMNNTKAPKLKLTEDERKVFMNEIVPVAKELSLNMGVKTNLDRLSEIKIIEKAGELDKEVFRELRPEIHKRNTFLDALCFEPWLWPKIEANGEVWPCSTTPLKKTVKNKSFKEIWYGEEMDLFRKRILAGKISESCKNCVMTHLPLNKELREKLNQVLR